MTAEGGLALAYVLVALFMGLAVLTVGWLVFRIFKFGRMVQKIHGSVSKRAYAHRVPLWNVIDPSALNEKEKIQRAEAIASLGSPLLVFFLFCCVIVSVVLVSS